MINNFRNKYNFLSNFYPCEIEYDGKTYQNSEAAFQAQKTLNEEEKDQFTDLNPSAAKRLGRRVQLRTDWEDIKLDVMYNVVYQKFKQNDDIRCKLLNTGDEELIEGNTWRDTYWGMYKNKDGNFVGENHLGKILMKVRDDLNEK